MKIDRFDKYGWYFFVLIFSPWILIVSLFKIVKGEESFKSVIRALKYQ